MNLSGATPRVSLRTLQKAGKSNSEEHYNWIATPLLYGGARADEVVVFYRDFDNKKSFKEPFIPYMNTDSKNKDYFLTITLSSSRGGMTKSYL